MYSAITHGLFCQEVRKEGSTEKMREGKRERKKPRKEERERTKYVLM